MVVSGLPTTLTRHGVTRVVDNVPPGAELDPDQLVSFVVIDLGRELHRELSADLRRQLGRPAPRPTPRPPIEVADEVGGLSEDEQRLLVALLKKQKGVL